MSETRSLQNKPVSSSYSFVCLSSFPFPSLSRVFLFLFFPLFYFSFFFFTFSCFSVLLPFPLNPHFLFLCNSNPRIEDATTEVKAACHVATISLPPPRSPYSSSGSSFPFLPIIFSFIAFFFKVLIIVIFSLIIPIIFLITVLLQFPAN